MYPAVRITSIFRDYLTLQPYTRLVTLSETLDIWGGGAQKAKSAQFASTDLAPSLSIPMLYYGGRSVFLTPDTIKLPASAAALNSIAFERASCLLF